MDQEAIDVIQSLIESNNRLVEKVLHYEKRVDEFSIQVDYIQQYFAELGDMGEFMVNVISDTLEKSDFVNKMVAETFMKSSEFLKGLTSKKYPYMNMPQEWFADLITIVLEEGTTYNRKFIEDWMSLKFRNFVHDNDETLPGTLDYLARIEFSESIFEDAISELNLDQNKGQLILRAMYIPYVTMYHQKPPTEYPSLDEWREALHLFFK